MSRWSISVVLLFVFVLVLGGCDKPEGPSSVPATPGQASSATSRTPAGNQPAAVVEPFGSVLVAEGNRAELAGFPGVLWRVDDTPPVTAWPVVRDNVIAAGFADYTVRAFSASDGEQIWAVDAAGLPASLVACGEGFLCASASETWLMFGEDGATAWSAEIGVSPSSGLTVVPGAVIVPRLDGSLTALSLADGVPFWTAAPERSGFPVTGGMAFDDGLIFAVTEDGQAFAADADSGEVRWSASVDAEMRSGPAVTGSGVVLVTAAGAAVRLDRDSGEASGAGTTGEAVLADPVPFDTSVVLVGVDGGVYRVAQEAVRLSILAHEPAGQPGLLDSVILVPSAAGLIIGVDPGNGRKVWDFDAGIRAGGVMSGVEGDVIVAGTRGGLARIGFDEQPDAPPILDATMPWALPVDRTFRMANRFVDFEVAATRSGVTRWTVSSTAADDHLVVMLMAPDGTLLATSSAGLATRDSVEVRVETGEGYLVRVERPWIDQETVVRLSSEIVQ